MWFRGRGVTGSIRQPAIQSVFRHAGEVSLVNMEQGEQAPETKNNLEKFMNQVVTVTVKDGRKFKGKLVQNDEFMNLVLEEAEELSKGMKFKFVFLKGGNVTDVSI
jgi:small nuclear ribonucleoprotein (snRNP)-like protein